MTTEITVMFGSEKVNEVQYFQEHSLIYLKTNVITVIAWSWKKEGIHIHENPFCIIATNT